MTLRPYQQEAVDAALGFMRESVSPFCIEAATGAWTNSTGAAVAFELKPTWNQTGDASAIGLLVNPTETAIGSGGYVPIDIRRNGKASTPTDGLLLTNTTAALVGAQVQMGPRLRIHGAAWDSATVNTDWAIDALPAAGTPITSTLRFGHSLGDAAYTYPATLTNAGNLTLLGGIIGGKFGTAALTADAAHRGQFYFTEGGAGVADKLYVIAKGADDNYTAVQVAIG
jgi:hypothetical protein